MSRRLAASLSLLTALALLLAACGDDGGDDQASTSTEATETTEDTSEPAETTTTAADDDAADGNDLAQAVLDAEDFCDLWINGGGEDGSVFDVSGIDPASDPEGIADAMSVADAFMVRGAELAPDEIKGDFTLVADVFSGLIDLVEGYDYDVEALQSAAETDPELQAQMAALDSPELDTAADNVEAYTDANC
jgi:hypothetical protein